LQDNTSKAKERGKASSESQGTLSGKKSQRFAIAKEKGIFARKPSHKEVEIDEQREVPKMR